MTMFRAKNSMRINFVGASGALFCLLLSACATDPLPDYRYFRPGAMTVYAALAKPALDGVLEVASFRADGVFGERPIVYTSASEPERLSQYHYQLWTDPPGTILQRRFIDVLSAMNAASSVTARASPRSEPAKLSGMIERLERIKRASGSWEVALTLHIKVEKTRGVLPVLEKTYARTLAVSGDSISASVVQFGVAIDQIAAEVARDLVPSATP
jgi:cholesterol transport system auxiliary component